MASAFAVYALVTVLSLLCGGLWWFTDGPVHGVAWFVVIWLCFFGGRISSGWNPLSGDK